MNLFIVHPICRGRIQACHDRAAIVAGFLHKRIATGWQDVTSLCRGCGHSDETNVS
jgi:hypothetical protein